MALASEGDIYKMRTLTQSTQLAYRAGFVKQAQTHFAKYQWAKQASSKMLKKLKELGESGSLGPKDIAKFRDGADLDRETLHAVLRIGRGMSAATTTAADEILHKLLIRTMMKNQSGRNLNWRGQKESPFNEGTIKRLEQLDPAAAKGLKQQLEPEELDNAITALRKVDTTYGQGSPFTPEGQLAAAGGFGPNVGREFHPLRDRGRLGNIITPRQQRIRDLKLERYYRLNPVPSRNIAAPPRPVLGPNSGYGGGPPSGGASTTGTPANLAEEISAAPAGMDIHPGLAALAGGVGGFGLSELMD